MTHNNIIDKLDINQNLIPFIAVTVTGLLEVVWRTVHILRPSKIEGERE